MEWMVSLYIPSITSLNIIIGWEILYQMQEKPWDLEQVTPAIKELLENNELPEKIESILVPGCGVGHDVIELSKKGAHVIGLDLSHSALQLALNVRII